VGLVEELSGKAAGMGSWMVGGMGKDGVRSVLPVFCFELAESCNIVYRGFHVYSRF
jgi:hypothetical protein